MRDLYTWASIAALVLASTAADVLMSRAMKRIGDLSALRRRQGLWVVIRSVLGSRTMVLSIGFMAIGFFTLLLALSWADVSLVVPAVASLTFVTNAIAAKMFLHENVNRRRWIAALLVCGGVALLAM